MLEILQALLLGAGFGFCLHKAGLTHYERIVNVYRLRDLTVIRFMLSALVVAALAIQTCSDLGWVHQLPVPPTRVLANLIGGVVFGVGMATAGYCPGTIVAEAGEGRLDAWIAGLTGLIAGALSFGLLYPHFMPSLARVGDLGRITLAQLSGANPWLVLLVFGQGVVLLLRVTRKHGQEEPAPT